LAEITAGDRPRQPAYEIKLMLSRVSRALAQKSEFWPKLLQEIDQDNLRIKLNWCCRASHKH